MLFNKPNKPKTTKSSYSEEEDGTMILSITFNPFNHGHDLGSARNYDPDEYKKMVESTSTQERIANGYSVGYYSHHSRQTEANYVPGERDEEGNTVFPCCKTLSMEWVEGEVKHTQRILSNEIGREVQTLIRNAVGGFSSVHDLEKKEFLGFDYVISPNFSSNRVLVDNLCKDGLCSVSMDTIKTNTENSVRGQIRRYLGTIGVDSIETENALFTLETHQDNTQLLMDTLTNQKEIVELEKKSIQLQLDDAIEEIGELKEQLSDTKEKLSKVELDTVNLENKRKETSIFETIDYSKEQKKNFDTIVALSKQSKHKPEKQTFAMHTYDRIIRG